jgi:hypothetical protein
MGIIERIGRFTPISSWHAISPAFSLRWDIHQHNIGSIITREKPLDWTAGIANDGFNSSNWQAL